MTELLPYTRKIDKEYQKLLFKSSVVNSDKEWNQNFSINPMDIQDAKDFLISSLTGLTLDEVSNLWMNEYETISKKIEEYVSSEKSGSVAGNPAKVWKSD